MHSTMGCLISDSYCTSLGTQLRRNLLKHGKLEDQEGDGLN